MNELVINHVRRFGIGSQRDEIHILPRLEVARDIRRLALVQRLEGTERTVVLEDDNRDWWGRLLADHRKQQPEAREIPPDSLLLAGSTIRWHSQPRRSLWIERSATYRRHGQVDLSSKQGRKPRLSRRSVATESSSWRA